MHAQTIGSDTKCSVTVSVAHAIEGVVGRRKALADAELSAQTISRFHRKIQKTPSCWLWIGTKERNGYGLAYTGKRPDGRKIRHYAHRIAYALHYGSAPAHLEVMHQCDIPGCVNPAHLRLGTHAENCADSARKGRRAKTKPTIRKISAEGVIEIRESNQSSEFFANRYGVSVSHVNRIRRGEKRVRG